MERHTILPRLKIRMLHRLNCPKKHYMSDKKIDTFEKDEFPEGKEEDIVSVAIRNKNSITYVKFGEQFCIGDIQGACKLLENKSFEVNLKSLVSDIQEVFPVACDVQILGSKATNSKSFHSHSDRGNLFIIQAIGDTAWIVFKNRISSMLSYFYNKPEKEVLTPDLEVTLSPGDLLYIPPATYHVATPSIPRLSMSIPCTPLDAYVYLKNILPGFDQNIINQLCPDVNKYEF